MRGAQATRRLRPGAVRRGAFRRRHSAVRVDTCPRNAPRERIHRLTGYFAAQEPPARRTLLPVPAARVNKLRHLGADCDIK